MKKTIVTIFTLLVVVMSFAQRQSVGSNFYTNYQGAQNSSVVFTSASITRDYVININNNYSYLLNASNNSATVSNLNNGNHQVEISKIKNTLFGGQRREVIYRGTINTRSGFETIVNINMFDEVNISDRQIFFNNGNNNGNNSNNGCNNNQYGNGNGKAWGKKKNKHKCCGNNRGGNRYGNNHRQGDDD